MKKLIGITPSLTNEEDLYSLNPSYCEAVEACGAVPLILSHSSINYCDKILETLDGVIFSGGGDIDPVFFNEEPIPSLGLISPKRDAFEILLCQKALQNNISVLGICRGIQVLNTAAGGTVLQNIDTVKNHVKHSQNAPKYYPTHKINIVENSILKNIFNADTISVNSFHKQAVGKIATCFKATSFSCDGLIESIEHTSNKFALGVQWHPECMFKKYKLQLKLFNTFINSCR